MVEAGCSSPPNRPTPRGQSRIQLENSGRVHEAIALYNSARSTGKSGHNGAMELLYATAAPGTFTDGDWDERPSDQDDELRMDADAAIQGDVPARDSPASWRRRLFRRVLALTCALGIDWAELVRQPQRYNLSRGGRHRAARTPRHALMPRAAATCAGCRPRSAASKTQCAVGSFPYRPAYQGFENMRFHTALAALYTKLSPRLRFVAPCRRDSAAPSATVVAAARTPTGERSRRPRWRVRLGVVSEYFGNASPSSSGVLDRLGRCGALAAENSHDDCEGNRFDITYFARLEPSRTSDGEHSDVLLKAMLQREAETAASNIAGDAADAPSTVRVVYLAADVAAARETISKASVLLYCAIGTNTLSYLLSFARLAPVQASFRTGIR